MDDDAVTRLAWLIWCFQEGYTSVADRAGMTNWLLEPDDQLHPDDRVLKPQLLAMAEEVLAAFIADPTVEETTDV